MSRPPDRPDDKPRRPFRERRPGRGDRPPRREDDGPRAADGRPRRPWRDKRPADREAGSEERLTRRPDRPRQAEGERAQRPSRHQRFGDGDRGQKRHSRQGQAGDGAEKPPNRDSDSQRADRRPHWQRRPEPQDEDRVLIWGIHAVDAALRNPKREIKRLLLTDNAAHRLAEALRLRAFNHQEVAPRDLDRELGPDTVHQGALLETAPLEEPSLDEVLAANPDGLLIVLDQLTDPHNVGAILRSAAAFGIAALVTTRRHSPPSGAALAKSASGALELVPVLHVPNLARAMAELGDQGVMRLGLDGEAPEALEEVVKVGAAPSGPIALVLGAEERGLRHLTKESCDRLVRLTTPGTLASLNVSNAAAIAMHHIAWARRKP